MGSMIREPFGAPFLMRKAYGEALVELGRARQDVVVLTADVCNSDFSFMFEAAFPERFFNVGIAEPALVDVAVGLANSGFVPIANTFAFLFATRAVEMVRTHLCFGGANVKLAGAYAGLSDSFDGPTHHSITDLAILRSLPGMTGPVFFRLSRNDAPQIFTEQYAPEIGKGIVLSEGEDVTVIACGVLVARALLAVRELRALGVAARLVEMHTIKPLDAALVEKCARETGAVVTVEEHSVIGGLGGAVAECLAGACPAPLERVGVNDTFAESGPYPELLDKYGMSVGDIVAAVRRVVGRKAAQR
jgi:transketolase